MTQLNLTAIGKCDPGRILIAAYGGELSGCYEWLLQNSGISPELLSIGMIAVAKKKLRLGGVLLGEILPLALSRHLEMPAEHRPRLFAAWLAIYSYIELVDRSIDAKQPLSPKAMLAANNLLAYGIATFSSYCSKESQRQLLIRNINLAFDGELQDQVGAGSERSDSDTNKNRALVVATLAFCMAADRCPDRYVSFVERLLPVFQFLDDVQDVREDLEQGTITSVVQAFLSQSGDLAPDLDDRQLYQRLVQSTDFANLLLTTTDLLENALVLLDFSRDSVLIQYFTSLLSAMRSLHTLCSEVGAGRVVEPEEVVRRVIRVAAST